MKALIFTISLLISTQANANQALSTEIEEAINNNLIYIQAEDTEGTMSTIHSQSAVYLPTKNSLPQIFGNYQLSYTILSYKLVGYDGELAYARIKQRTKKISGPAFQNNDLDMLQIFKQEAGVWKLWGQANMSVEYFK